MHKTLNEFIIIIFILAVLIGCKSNINKENYNQLKVGMKYKQVVELFGKPNMCDSTTMHKSCTWGNEKKYIYINFVDGKVALFLNNGL